MKPTVIYRQAIKRTFADLYWQSAHLVIQCGWDYYDTSYP
jgi:hypothetical protein